MLTMARHDLDIFKGKMSWYAISLDLISFRQKREINSLVFQWFNDNYHVKGTL